jgi:hypothetical protein
MAGLLYGRRKFRITEFVQPEHPVIKGLSKYKTVREISEYWRDCYDYDEQPPFRLLTGKGKYIFECPDDFALGNLIEHIFHTKKADCWGGSCFVASLYRAQGYAAWVCIGELVSVHNEGLRWPHAWVSVNIPDAEQPLAVEVFEDKK